MEILLSLSVALFAGLMLSRLAKLVQLPAVTAYLVAGIFVGPHLMELITDILMNFDVTAIGPFAVDRMRSFVLISEEQIEAFGIISDVALGFIAFSIGNEFRLSQLRQTGKQATVIGIVQAVFTTLVVDAALIGLHFMFPDKLPLPSAIILGAVASATAPAATLMVVKQYKAKGPLTDLLLPIVALDDAVGLVLFAVSFGIAKALISGSVSIVSIILEPILEVVLSLGLGFVMGLFITFFERFFHSRSKRLSMSVTFVLLTVAISKVSFSVELFGAHVHVAFSSLLTCMMLGTVFCNCCDFSEELMDRLDRWTGPLYILFFVLSGAELELSVFTDVVIVGVGVAYIVFRCLGKYFGSGISAKSVKCTPDIVKYLGITLFPQAGVALGMAIKAKEYGAQVNSAECAIVANITLFSVLIYELVGPFLTKVALTKAGEIKPEGKTSAREEAKKAMESVNK